MEGPILLCSRVMPLCPMCQFLFPTARAQISGVSGGHQVPDGLVSVTWYTTFPVSDRTCQVSLLGMWGLEGAALFISLRCRRRSAPKNAKLKRVVSLLCSPIILFIAGGPLDVRRMDPGWDSVYSNCCRCGQ